MAVVQQVRLNILSRQEIKDLEDRIVQLESLAERKRIASEKIQAKRSGNVKGPKGTIFQGLEDQEALPSSIIRRRNKTLTERMADSKDANTFKQKDTNSAAPIKKNAEFKKVLRRLDALDQKAEVIEDKVKEFSKIANDPLGAFIGEATNNSRFLTRFFGAVAVATILFKLFEKAAMKLFGPGGALDVRVLFRNEARSINQLDLLVDIAQGKVFYSTDLRTFQGVVGNSSTEDQGEQDQFYKEQVIGSNLIG